MKKIISILLSFAMLFSVMSAVTIAPQAATAHYSSNYRKWSQGKSAYKGMRKYGCWVVAQAKLIREAGINTKSSFNPDVYYKWEKKNGCIDNGMYQTAKGGVNAPVLYAKSLKNNSLKYLGKTKKDIINKCISNAKKGYFTIVRVKNSQHYFMVDNKYTKANNKVYIYDSWNSPNNPPRPMKLTYSEKNWKPKYHKRLVEIYTYSLTIKKSSGTSTTPAPASATTSSVIKKPEVAYVTSPSVAINAVSNVTSTSAQINFTAKNPNKLTIKTVGAQVRKKGSSSWTTKTEAMNKNYTNATSTPMWWTIGSGKEINMSLTQNTTYEYRAFVIYNGIYYYSSISSFTTKSTLPYVKVRDISNLTKTSAQINFTAKNPNKLTIKTVGAQVRKKGSSSWTTKTEAMNKNYTNATSTPMWWTVGSGKEINFKLSAGTTYEYRAFVVYSGTKYYSPISTFKTKS
ncbi:MAG: hypothetical protein IJI47_02845 [Eubacterium sp.]|nr:hypothetical protein [Eubacterium sp.]